MFPFTLKGSLRPAERCGKRIAQTIVDMPQRVLDKPHILGLVLILPWPSAAPRA
jgi:hypothetical protein